MKRFHKHLIVIIVCLPILNLLMVTAVFFPLYAQEKKQLQSKMDKVLNTTLTNVLEQEASVNNEIERLNAIYKVRGKLISQADYVRRKMNFSSRLSFRTE